MTLEIFESLTDAEKTAHINHLLALHPSSLSKDDKDILNLHFYTKSLEYHKLELAKETCPYCGEKGFDSDKSRHNFIGFMLHDKCLDDLEDYFKFHFSKDDETMCKIDHVDINAVFQMIADARKDFNNLLDVLKNKNIISNEDISNIKG
ncbi:hypothetical protein [uncultured Brachyspira sp.]|uniref:hypothetical protein n=1 Tax=uncultured Brachyspira sp. TaxID=221953 RepID=UPI0025FCA997|nr:hypothetical protein [uncultured Brachyspira sp.]